MMPKRCDTGKYMSCAYDISTIMSYYWLAILGLSYIVKALIILLG
jgi:hypothetical protein